MGGNNSMAITMCNTFKPDFRHNSNFLHLFVNVIKQKNCFGKRAQKKVFQYL